MDDYEVPPTRGDDVLLVELQGSEASRVTVVPDEAATEERIVLEWNADGSARVTI